MSKEKSIEIDSEAIIRKTPCSQKKMDKGNKVNKVLQGFVFRFPLVAGGHHGPVCLQQRRGWLLGV